MGSAEIAAENSEVERWLPVAFVELEAGAVKPACTELGTIIRRSGGGFCILSAWREAGQFQNTRYRTTLPNPGPKTRS